MVKDQADPEILAEFERQLTPEVLERLLVYAYRQIDFRPNRGASEFGIVADADEITLPGAVSPNDIVHEAVKLILEGTRAWNRIESPNLEEHLKSVIDSLLNHMWEKAARSKKRNIAIIGGELAESTLECIPDSQETDRARHAAIESEERECLTRFRDFVRSRKDEVLDNILECFRAGVEAPREISAYLGIDVKEVYKAKKRLERAVADFRKLSK